MNFIKMFYEFQKILTAIVVVVLVVFGISKISNFIFKTETNVVAYKVEVHQLMQWTTWLLQISSKANSPEPDVPLATSTSCSEVPTILSPEV